MFFYNIGKVQLSDVVGISSIIILLTVILFPWNFLLLRDINKAALVTIIFSCIFLYFRLIEKVIIKIFPMLYYWHIALICLFIFGHLAYLIHKRMATPIVGQINQGILIVFTGLILFNGARNIPQLIKNSYSEKQNSNQSQVIQGDIGRSAVDKALPNVYFFIFDEYAGYDCILRYCNYDNVNFYNSLEELGFATSKHSRNGTIDTFTEIPNLLQLQKVNSVDMSANEKKEKFKNPYLFILMKNNGYAINLLDTSNYQFLDDTYADYKLTTNFVSTFRTFNSYIIDNTAFYPFYGYNDQNKEINLINKMFAYGEESSHLQENDLLTVGYFDFPHLPYIVDENGNKTSNADQSNLSDPVPYLGQFKYASKKILQMVQNIIKNDQGSIIILQSDHGYRLPEHLYYWYDIESYDLEAEMPYEENILNAVYYQGKDLNIEGLSGLNTLKLVLNQLLGTDLQIEK
jgi:hypothetical protein